MKKRRKLSFKKAVGIQNEKKSENGDDSLLSLSNIKKLEKKVATTVCLLLY
jgi:hypothetical protein